ncbi:hypothetical protein ACS0TY_021705 [Phlomoides rotata]
MFPSLYINIHISNPLVTELSMADEGDETLDLGELAVIDRGPVMGRPVCLTGRLLSEKPVNSYALQDVMKKAFKPKGKLMSHDWGEGLIIFLFERQEDREWVVRNQPWHFDNNLFLVQSLSGLEQPSMISLLHASMWIRVYDVPLALHSEDVIRMLANKLGILECFELPSVQEPEAFLRFKVSLNATKPLMRGLSIKFGGDPVWVPFKYESLPIFCYNCGILGHQDRACPLVDRDVVPDRGEFRYGASIRAPTRHRGPPSVVWNTTMIGNDLNGGQTLASPTTDISLAVKSASSTHINPPPNPQHILPSSASTHRTLHISPSLDSPSYIQAQPCMSLPMHYEVSNHINPFPTSHHNLNTSATTYRPPPDFPSNNHAQPYCVLSSQNNLPSDFPRPSTPPPTHTSNTLTPASLSSFMGANSTILPTRTPFNPHALIPIATVFSHLFQHLLLPIQSLSLNPTTLTESDVTPPNTGIEPCSKKSPTGPDSLLLGLILILF